MFCNNIKGIMRKLAGVDNKWVHMVCVKWIPEIWFENKDKTVLSGKVTLNRYSKGCYICRKAAVAVCIDCDFRGCTRGFHIWCGVE